MIFRLSQKLNSKIKVGTLPPLPLNENPIADWSAHLFVADRKQYLLLSNTSSLYSTVVCCNGITNESKFVECAVDGIREFMEDDAQEFVYRRFISPHSGAISFAKALNRSVIGSMTDMIHLATAWLIEGELSPHEIGFRLNETPFSSLKYINPRETFKNLASEP